MSKSSKRVLFSAASALAVATMMGPASYAQEAEAAPSDDQKTLDTIVVTGIAASISQSVADKRNASQIVDTINAEDIGKSTDQNIAEALNRVSGVSLSTVDGEGALISIRGASPEQTVVTLNGSTLGSTGFGQAVDLSSYSADILSKVEVVKAPSADDEEGSLGGLVNLITRKPLEIDENVRTFSVQGRYAELVDDADYKLSGTVSQKFFDDKFGIILSVVDETQSQRRDQIQFNSYDTFRSFHAEDTNGNVYTSPSYAASDAAIYGIAPRAISFGVFEGTRDRQAIDGSVQWQITDKTDVTGNFSFGRQEVDNTFDSHTIRSNDQIRNPNFAPIDALHPINLPFTRDFRDADGNLVLDANGDPQSTTLFFPNHVDPSNWQIVNTETRTWERVLKRFDTGDVNAGVNRWTNDNTTGSIEINHEFTDKLRLKVGVSHQKAEQIPDQQLAVNLQAAREQPEYGIFNVSPDVLQPIGFDCLGGSCQGVTGTAFIDLGTAIDGAPDGGALAAQGIFGVLQGAFPNETNVGDHTITIRGDDNVRVTGVNPDDILAKSVGNASQTVRAVEDEQNVAFFDVDYDLDRFGLTTIEFGAKYTERSKFVDNQNGLVTNLNAAATVINPATGTPVLVSNALDQTPVLPFAKVVNPDGLFDGLDAGAPTIGDGFVSIQAEELFNLITSDEGTAFDIDDSETRSAEFTNQAAYLKTNFSFMDDRITGDIGVRYVKTEVETAGSGGLRTFSESFGRNQRIWDLRVLRGLMDTSLPACPDIWTAEPAATFDPTVHWAQGDIYRFSRVDGTGVDTNGTLTDTDDVRIPDQGPCHETALVNGIDFLQNGVINGVGARVALRRHNNTFFTNNDFFTFSEDNPNGGFVSINSGGSNNTIHTVPAEGAHEYEVWLPNLNLNYEINDEFTARFAASKTMTRPNIDSLRPGFSISETGWGDPQTRLNNVQLFNTNLNPLESINIDVSLEWYFQKDALLSVGLFYKDITDLEESEEQNVFLSDVRTAVQNGESVDASNLILSGDQITLDNCYAEILGEWQIEYNRAFVEQMLFGNDPSALCAQFRASQVRNAAGAEIQGAEIQYVQNFSNLPGIWGGLGISANYTYQDSSFEAEVSDLAPGAVLPSFQIDRTPEHSYNVTGYWQQDGHQVRLAYGGASDVLLQRAFQKGSLWEEGRETLDFSAAYQLSDNFSLTFDASNLLDQSYRTYFTSRTIALPEDPTGGVGAALVDYDEGNPLDGDAYKGRTVTEYNTGRIFRLGLRAEF